MRANYTTHVKIVLETFYCKTLKIIRSIDDGRRYKLNFQYIYTDIVNQRSNVFYNSLCR